MPAAPSVQASDQARRAAPDGWRSAAGQGTSTRVLGGLAAAALAAMVAAHVVGAAVVDPFVDPVSFYAFVPGGGELILLGGSLLAVLGLVLVARAYAAGLARGGGPMVAMTVFAVAMVLVGLFPTDPPGVDTTVSAVVHRVSAATAFGVLPLVGLGVARTIAAPRSAYPARLRRTACALAVLVGAFPAIHLPLAAAGSGIAAFGFLERAGFVIMIGYLFLLARTVDLEAGEPGDAGPAARTAVPAPVTVATSTAPVGTASASVIEGRDAALAA